MKQTFGDFILVPAFVPRRVINPSDSDPFRWVVVRSTSTPIVGNLPDYTWPEQGVLAVLNSVAFTDTRDEANFQELEQLWVEKKIGILALRDA
jgi:uncharacterized RmlC-like cupin family protein